MPNPNPETGHVKKFSKDYQPGGSGPKPSKLRKYIKEISLGADDVSLIVKNVILVKTEDELKKILTERKEPMIVRLFVKAFLSDFRNSSLANVDKLLDRAIGKAVAVHEVSGPGGSLLTVKLTREERQDRIDNLNEKRHANPDDE